MLKWHGILKRQSSKETRIGIKINIKVRIVELLTTGWEMQQNITGKTIQSV